MLDWLIIGGGIHGTYISNYLLKTQHMDRDKLAVVDPHDAPLEVWNRCSDNTCMRYLRSPGEHHLDVGAGALMRFAIQNFNADELYSKYKRPSLRLFNAHCSHVIDKADLTAVRIKASAQHLRRTSDGFVLTTETSELAAKRVILSIGTSDCLRTPEWAHNLSQSGAPVSHVFSADFRAARAKDWDSAVVVGGGISAAQLALSLAQQRPGAVTLVHGAELRTRQFDADPCWLDSRCLKFIRQQPDFAERRRIVDHARHWGSFPVDVRNQLYRAITEGALRCVRGNVADASGCAGAVAIKLDTGEVLEADFLALATGFARCRPGGEFINKMVNELALPCAPCGFPIADERLRWSAGLFVTGPLAELIAGPASRNIVGARFAADRIIQDVHPKRAPLKEYNYHIFQRRRTS